MFDRGLMVSSASLSGKPDRNPVSLSNALIGSIDVVMGDVDR